MYPFPATDTGLPDRRILVVSDSSDELFAVRDLLTPDLGDYWLADSDVVAVRLLVDKRPTVVILAFLELKAAERFCLTLRRCCGGVEDISPQLLVLCRSGEAGLAYSLCACGMVDDYLVNRPLHDVLRFRLSVSQAHDRYSLCRRSCGSGGPCRTVPPLPGVLLVEDNPLYQEVLTLLLDEAGLRPLLAGSGEEALAQVRWWRPDLILLDYHMPGIDGLETLRRMRTHHGLAAVPAIMLTGASERRIIDMSIRSGVQDFIVKPSDRDTILGKIFGVLQGGAADGGLGSRFA